MANNGAVNVNELGFAVPWLTEDKHKTIAIASPDWSGAFIINDRMRMGTLTIADRKDKDGKVEYAVVLESPESNAAITVTCREEGTELIKWVVMALVGQENTKMLREEEDGTEEASEA